MMFNTMRNALLKIILLCGIIPAFLAIGETPLRADDENTLLMLTANVGNIDFMNCSQRYNYKLCLFKWEKILSENITKIKPDIVTLQEILDIQWCEGWEEKDSRKVCHHYAERQPFHQARRLLGDAYTIVCDGGANYECLGVRTDVGEVEGCPKGELCRSGEAMRVEIAEGCEAGSSISAVNVKIGDKKLHLINAHPQAKGSACRAETLRRMFEGSEKQPPLISKEMPNLIMGDMNLDPFRDKMEPSVEIWNHYVGNDKQFKYLSGSAEHDPPFPTDAGRTLDHVISDVAAGSCLTLGEATGTQRLDGVEKDKTATDANDHRAILCKLKF
jgi:hypothetical protein